ncbi:MAG: endo alpha-1,4 polygalactosaminidase [Nanoarchaeota archaeon]|nr:endo alpha-1,4 polygalactosaminidase [Nanoarchaeota archaeon]
MQQNTSYDDIVTSGIDNSVLDQRDHLGDTTPSSPSEGPIWWKPQPELTWHWQLQGDLQQYDVDVYDIDLEDTSSDTILQIHLQGKKVICYFSAGSYEEWRSDSDQFPESVLGNTLDGWPDERWLDVRSEVVKDIMLSRLDLAQSKGCDGVEPDNVDGYMNNTGLSLTAADQLDYNRWLATQAHQRGLAIGLKNDLDQIDDLVSSFDFAVNEQCFEYDECELLLPFIKQDKAVFGVEYELSASQFCQQANEYGFSWLEMDYDLDGARIGC